MTDRRPDPRAAVEELVRRLPAAEVVTDAGVVETYRNDQTALLTGGMPIAVVRARSTATVSEALRIATRHGVPVVPRGAGSGLAGGACAVDGGIVLTLERMDAIRDIDETDMQAVVEPGVLNGTLAREAAGVGLWYPPDPASRDFSTIGGNIATNAGGLCCLRYGVTRDYVLGLEIVLADGRVVRTGRQTVKGVAGYDLTSLVVGSEGTLAVVTEARLRLRPAPPPAATLVASFGDLPAAGRAVARLLRLRPRLLEIVDRSTIEAVESWKRMELDTSAAALLFAQFEAVEVAGRLDDLRRLCTEAGADLALATESPEEGDLLLDARRLAYPALERLGGTLLDDVAVPPSALPALLAGVEAISRDTGVRVATFGHAGDGNMHPTLVFDRSDDREEQAARKAFADVVRLALELGGTCTGEHGVGQLKLAALARELDPGALQMMREIRRTLDPTCTLNPGKALG